jgi:serine/threonine protein phosphatase PrpC
VCDKLIEDDDLSGSTGVVVVYDGRKNMLTLANVGDSMCVLSRGGRAINVHRMHRLDDADERARVEAAGGTIIKNRYGVLALLLTVANSAPYDFNS